MNTILATFTAATVTSDADVSAVCGALADIATAARLKAAHAALVAEELQAEERRRGHLAPGDGRPRCVGGRDLPDPRAALGPWWVGCVTRPRALPARTRKGRAFRRMSTWRKIAEARHADTQSTSQEAAGSPKAGRARNARRAAKVARKRDAAWDARSRDAESEDKS